MLSRVPLLPRFILGPLMMLALGAAGPANLPPPVPDLLPLAPAPAPAQPVPARSFHNMIYQAAPIPNPDAGPPSSSAPAEAEIVPRLITTHNLFEGDGYAYASADQNDARKTPAAGLGLRVPVDQP